jgi:Domain of unknown function (DUF4189)
LSQFTTDEGHSVYGQGLKPRTAIIIGATTIIALENQMQMLSSGSRAPRRLGPRALTGLACLLLGAVALMEGADVQSYGAIAFSPASWSTGAARALLSGNADVTKRSVVNQALRNCRKEGATDCAIVIDYINACGAVAAGSRNQWATAVYRSNDGHPDSSGIGVKSRAQNACRAKTHDNSCMVLVSDCAMTIRFDSTRP